MGYASFGLRGWGRGSGDGLGRLRRGGTEWKRGGNGSGLTLVSGGWEVNARVNTRRRTCFMLDIELTLGAAIVLDPFVLAAKKPSTDLFILDL